MTKGPRVQLIVLKLIILSNPGGYGGGRGGYGGGKVIEKEVIIKKGGYGGGAIGGGYAGGYGKDRKYSRYFVIIGQKSNSFDHYFSKYFWMNKN